MNATIGKKKIQSLKGEDWRPLIYFLFYLYTDTNINTTPNNTMATVTDTKSPTTSEISSQTTDATTNKTTPEGLDATNNQTTPEGPDATTNQTAPEGPDATTNQTTPEGPDATTNQTKPERQNSGLIAAGIMGAVIFVSVVLSLGVVLVIVAIWRKKHKKQVTTYDEGTDQHGAINRKTETVFTEVNGLSDEIISTAKNKACGQYKVKDSTLTLST